MANTSNDTQASGQNTVDTAPEVEPQNDEAIEEQKRRDEAEKVAKREAAKAKREGFVNALGEPRVTPAPDPEAAFGALPRPKYEVDSEGGKDPLTGAVPGTELSRQLDSPESPHLGRRYVPGSANSTAEVDQFRGVPNSPPSRG